MRNASDPFRMRIEAVLMAKQGVPGVEIAAQLNVREQTVYGWVRKYNQGAADALKPQRQGRPPLIPPDQRADLIQTLRSLARAGGQITTSDVKRAIERDLGVQMKTEETARSLIRECGFGWKFTELKRQR